MNELTEDIKQDKVILFVGAGVSKILGLPSFKELINHIAKELDFDPDLFHDLGDYLTLAEYYKLQKGVLGPLRSWMDTNWHKPEIDIGKSEVHRLIVQLHFPIIYTTNYDRWLEKAFEYFEKPFIKIAGVADLRKIREGITQIIKYHGDFDSDESIVLTESSYFERLNFQSPLDIKLKNDLFGKSILFLGYSLTDINIRYLLYQIYCTWSDSKFSYMRPKSYILLARPNVVQQKVLEARGITPLVSESDDPKESVKSFLEQLLGKIGL
jgi:hypothetical protein